MNTLALKNAQRTVTRTAAVAFIILVTSHSARAQLIPDDWFRFDDGADNVSRAEPFGAEDFGSQDNPVQIPEPMVFDLVRPLGADRGEFEMNVLGEFPLGSARQHVDEYHGGDEFEPRGVEWAPEIEYAVRDGFAVEFELPYEDRKLEAYKAAFQLTFGTGLDNRFIHGAQVIIEPDIHFEEWELTGLYLAGLKFSETWSMLAMIGMRSEIAESEGVEHNDGLFNLAIFADLTYHVTAGLEADLTYGESERTSLLLMPQLNCEITDHFEVQAGVGVDFTDADTVPLAATRIIYSR